MCRYHVHPKPTFCSHEQAFVSESMRILNLQCEQLFAAQRRNTVVHDSSLHHVHHVHKGRQDVLISSTPVRSVLPKQVTMPCAAQGNMVTRWS